MKIKVLLKRECLYSIIGRTLLSIMDVPELLTTLSSGDGYRVLMANSHLNYIAPILASRSTFTLTVKEYTRNKNIWLTPFQFLYVILSTSKYFKIISSSHIVRSPFYLKKGIIIIPGNHRIRFYDSVHNAITTVLKSNEDSIFIKNDISIRTRYPLTYCPKILSYGDGWYIESVILGNHINRGYTAEVKNKYIKMLYDRHCAELLRPSMNEVSAGEHYNNIVNLIKEHLGKLDSVDEIVYDAVVLLEARIVQLKKSSVYIPVCITHGDFQEGNILIADNGTFILDWENMNMRFCLYDEFVLLSGIRSLKSYSVKNAFEIYIERLRSIPGSTFLFNKYITDYTHSMILSLLSIEEMIFTIYDQYSRNYSMSSDKLQDQIKYA